MKVFFDIDGTLHKEDLFLGFILFLFKKRCLIYYFSSLLFF